MPISFQRARKAQSFLRMAIAAPSGAGKTYTALELATGLAGDKPIAVIDTERGSASKYADLFTFDVLELDEFHPQHYIEAIEAAAAAGYGALIIDSLSHAWNGTGGALELHDQAVKRQKTQNSYTAWADITPLQNRLINAITGAPLHIIATMRSKTEYVQDRNERGGTTIRKVGMAPIQRDGMEYEFDIFGQMTVDHDLIIEKSRCPALASAVINRPDARLAETLAEWLTGKPPLIAAARRASATPTPAASAEDEAATASATPTTHDPFIPERNPNVKRGLVALGHITIGEQHEYITSLRKQFAAEHLDWDEDAVMAHLRDQYKQASKAAAAKKLPTTQQTKQTDAPIDHDLRDLGTGASAH